VRIILLLLLCPSFAFSQYTLNGTITDSESGETLIGAVVVANDGSNDVVAVSNEYGFYALDLPLGTYTLSCNYIGYKESSDEVDFTENRRVDISLELEGSAIEEIIIETDAFDNIESTEMSTQKLDMSTIRQVPVVLGEADILKNLQLLPGVSNAGEGSSGINVRGGAADQNLILFDEATIYNSDHLLGLISVFNSDAVKDVKIYKGGIPSRYGGRLSSVIDVRQKEGNNKEFKVNGGIGLISSRLMAEGPIEEEKSSFLVAGRRSYADVFLGLIDNPNRLYFYDLNAKVNREFSDKSKMYLSGYFGKDTFNIDNLFKNSWGNKTGTLRWNYLLSDKLFSNTSLIYSQYDYLFDFDLLEFDWVSDITNLNAKTDFQYFINNNNTMYFGAEVKDYDFNPGIIKPTTASSGIVPQTLIQKQAIESAAYLGNEQKIGDAFTINYGMRFSFFDRRGPQALREYANDAPIVYNSVLDRYEDGVITGESNNQKSLGRFYGWEPRVGMTFLLNDESSVKASYNRTKQYIHLMTNTNSPTPIDIWAPSGPFIEPQQSDQIALGYFRNIGVTDYEISAEVYYRDLDNLVDFVDGAFLIANDYLENVLLSGEGRAYGLELYVKKNVGRLNGWLSYTLSKTEKITPGLGELDKGLNNGEYYPANYDKPHDLSITALYSLNQRWTLGANGIYQTGKPVTFPVGSYKINGFDIPLYEGRNQARLPDYHRIDLSATLDPKPNSDKKIQGQWVFSVYNAYNRKNASSIYFSYDADEQKTVAEQLTIFKAIPSVSYNFEF